MVERQKSHKGNGKRSALFWLTGAALSLWFSWAGAVISLVVAAVFFTDSTMTVQADTPLARPAATLPPPAPKDLVTGVPIVPAKKKPVMAFDALRGIATWYGKVLNGRRTSSGERFNMMAMTCAHKTLPFGTLVRVVDLDTHKSVVVRVTDRGELPDNHVIDLSYGAARELGTLKRGVANVRLEVIPQETSSK
jgi:rare lipoprotein A